ncbi:MAG: glycoside hydrolase family 78 protein [Firmicutes bacterium]|nr:glycoside hydrolase family 78 protein [Bacillota bacterium]
MGFSSVGTPFEGAVWIGSPLPSANTDVIGEYEVLAEFKIEEGTKFGIALCARNKDNYILAEGDTKTEVFSVYEYGDNMWEDGIPYVKERARARMPALKRGFNEIKINVAFGRASVFINGAAVIEGDAVIPRENRVRPLRGTMMNIGLKQEDGAAVYKRLRVTTPDNRVCREYDFKMPSPLGTVKDGLLYVRNEFNLTNPVPSVNLRRLFTVSKPVKKARLISTARGFYEAYINGSKVGDEYFAPGFSDYRRRIYYQTNEVDLKLGVNSIGATVTKGYYSGFVGYSGAEIYGKQSSFIARLDIEYEDGTRDVIVTDESWQFTDGGQVICADYQQGEYCDARFTLDLNDENDNRWGRCKEIPFDAKAEPTNGTLDDVYTELVPQDFSGARLYKSMPCVLVSSFGDNRAVYDFGQNIVGTVRVELCGKRGQTIKINYGEMLREDGGVYVANLRSAANTDVYVLRGGGKNEVFEPSFTAHGFRYAEIRGCGGDLNVSEIVKRVEGRVITNVLEDTGHFECSNPYINRLQSNIEWGQRGNSLLVFTDCPQRNERMGWTGDMQVFAKTAAYNADIRDFAKKWLRDLRDAQLMYNRSGAVPDTAPLGGDNRPMGGCGGWGDAAVIVPWEMYRAYGDIGFLSDNYEMMKKWVDYQSGRENYGLRVVDGKSAPERSDLADIPFIQIQQSRGDHLAYDESTPFILSATAYAAHSARLLSKTARILGYDGDSKKYAERFENIKRAFNSAWVDDDGGISYWGEQSKSCADSLGRVINQTRYGADGVKASQTAYALAIDFDLIPESKLKKTAEHFKSTIEDNKLTVGFLGISHLIPALVKAGYTDIAFALLEQTENPSWLYSVINGATTIWERWNSYNAETKTFGDVNMNSFNHYAYGAVGEWLFGGILGINTSEDEPGYRRIVLKPQIGGTLTYAKGFYNSPRGKIASEWRIESGKLIYRCEIPSNTSAELHLPYPNERCKAWGQIKFMQGNGKKSVFALGAGRAEFEISI